MKMNWTVPEETIKTVKCKFCGETGDLAFAEQHLKEKKYYKDFSIPFEERRWQFTVLERKDEDSDTNVV